MSFDSFTRRQLVGKRCLYSCEKHRKKRGGDTRKRQGREPETHERRLLDENHWGQYFFEIYIHERMLSGKCRELRLSDGNLSPKDSEGKGGAPIDFLFQYHSNMRFDITFRNFTPRRIPFFACLTREAKNLRFRRLWRMIIQMTNCASSRGFITWKVWGRAMLRNS